jgi:hypothetical protein
MKRYDLRMNLLKCAFGVSMGKFLGFIVHENGIEIDPKKVEAISRIEESACKKDMQSLLGKVNYLHRFISNLAGRVESLLSWVRLKHKENFVWGQSRSRPLKKQRISSFPTGIMGTSGLKAIQGIHCGAGESCRGGADAGGWR